MTSEVLRGILIPFLGTSAGAACVFFMKKELSANVQRALSGFAAGSWWRHRSGACLSRPWSSADP